MGETALPKVDDGAAADDGVTTAGPTEPLSDGGEEEGMARRGLTASGCSGWEEAASSSSASDMARGGREGVTNRRQQQGRSNEHKDGTQQGRRQQRVSVLSRRHSWWLKSGQKRMEGLEGWRDRGGER